ncbi:phosphatidylglycerophosphatase A family protein [Caldisalinibacter kiritimatiensis]|uniref:Low temperature requirement C protein n=1 Tax=Caldisalinibacter kiritimatiensis TaxID=1304284 RepID=R1ATJ5_9FIRM|nr:phosphatidylglycerophosphatase A [Caldisalinibacter kiritimatiensis]EOD00438.1 Low temperature requirement C protein [Caldisalinibacter kiritimatiensis]
MKDTIVKMLQERGVTIEAMAELVYELQKPYLDVTIEEAIFNIHRVLNKREVQNAILTGIQLDKLAEQNLIEEPLLSIIQKDASLYGIDEVLALSITNIYGSIGFTNFGYLDKIKLGIIGKLDKTGKNSDKVNTFLDDLVCGIIAAACSRIAHSRGDD